MSQELSTPITSYWPILVAVFIIYSLFKYFSLKINGNLPSNDFNVDISMEIATTNPIPRAIKNNWPHLLWTAVCFLITWLIFGASQSAFFTTLMIYAVSIAIAFTPLAEAILRHMYGARELERARDIEDTHAPFNEVYETARSQFQLPDGITLYLESSIAINAFALGRKTVAITKGSLMTLTEEELKGLFAHELGHIIGWNTQALLITLVCNLFLTIFIWIAMKILNILFAMTYRNSADDFFLITWLFKTVAWGINLIPRLGNLLLMANSRSTEFEADNYAVALGYGDGLLSVLYRISDMEMDSKQGFFDKLKNSHPYTSTRIKRIEANL